MLRPAYECHCWEGRGLQFAYEGKITRPLFIITASFVDIRSKLTPGKSVGCYIEKATGTLLNILCMPSGLQLFLL